MVVCQLPLPSHLSISLWLAWSALKDPSNSEKRLNTYATYAFGA